MVAQAGDRLELLPDLSIEPAFQADRRFWTIPGGLRDRRGCADQAIRPEDSEPELVKLDDLFCRKVE